mgnify:FL=1
MMIKKPYHLTTLAMAALSTTSNFDNFASALDDHGRGLRGNAMAMANGSVNIDLKGRKLSIDVDGNHHQHQQRNLKKKQPATTGEVRSKVFLIHHSHLTEILSNSKRSPSPHPQLMEELEEVQAEEENKVEWQGGEVWDESVAGQLEEELEEVQAKEENEVEWREGAVLDELVGKLEQELKEDKKDLQLEEEEGEVLGESLLDESLVEQLEEFEEVEWEKEVQLEEGEVTDESLEDAQLEWWQMWFLCQWVDWC